MEENSSIKWACRLPGRKLATLRNTTVEGATAKRRLVSAMQADVEFLRASGLMDYSMLVGIERKESKESGEAESNKHRFVIGDKIYHLAIIDYL